MFISVFDFLSLFLDPLKLNFIVYYHMAKIFKLSTHTSIDRHNIYDGNNM